MINVSVNTQKYIGQKAMAETCMRHGPYLEHAIGNSQEPGTDCTTMFDSFTPNARSLSFVPLRRGSIIAGPKSVCCLCL